MSLINRRVFLAAPYSQWMDPSTGKVDSERRETLDRTRQAFLNAGAAVFSAHHNEEWGAGWLPAHECTPADFHAIRAADVVCAIVGAPQSGGVAVELGWASASGRPVVVILTPDVPYTPMIHGIGTVTRAVFIEDRNHWDEGFTLQVVSEAARIALVDNRSHDRDQSTSLGYVLPLAAVR